VFWVFAGSRIKRGSAASKVNYNEKVLVKTGQDTWAEEVLKFSYALFFEFYPGPVLANDTRSFVFVQSLSWQTRIVWYSPY